MPRALVLGDLHLRSGGDPRAARALLGLLEREPDASVVFAGDCLDLAAETCDEGAAVAHTLSVEPRLAQAIAERAARGVRTVFVAGNHDAAIAHDAATRALHDLLGLAPEDRRHVRTEPWFVQLAGGAVHVEHGHVYDPDGAPAHPLAPIARDDVGISILRRFIVPVDAHELVAHNAEAPLPLLMRVIRKYGARAPYVIYLYIHSAFATWLSSGDRYPLGVDRAEGARRIEAYAREAGVDRETLDLLLDAHATPTRAHASETFLRLYLDRVLATTAVLGGASMGVAGAALGVTSLSIAGLPIAAVGALSLAASLLTTGINRYGGRVERTLAEGAARAAEITGAKTVILGHAHVDASGPRYRNTASFAFLPGHPYLRVEDDGTVERGFAR
jgi:UDP-2,3-diacylglucosamine pyrophosphatase LpxH